MRPGAGKAKGGAFERLICKQLSLWVSHGRNEDLFWRSAMSGGRASVGAKRGKDLRRQAGDISAVAPEGHVLTDKFYVECKAYKRLKIPEFLFKGTGILADFWATAKVEAARHGKNPLMIVKQNQFPVLLLVEWETMPLLCDPNGLAKVSLDGWTDCDIYLFDSVLEKDFKS